MAKYLDSTGLTYLWAKIKNYVGNYVKLSNGKITIGSNEITPLTSHQDISGKADKSEMAVSTSGDQTTITLKTGTSATVINAHQSLSGKQDVIDASHTLSADLVSDGTTNKAYTATEKTKLSGIATGAEVNQNAFSNVKVGSTTIAADGKTDTLEIAGGGDVTVTPDATNDKVTISVTTPKNTSDLTNDSGFITTADIPEGAAASTTTPEMDGTAAVGTELAFARGDHRHPSDTSKADKATTLAGYGITDAKIAAGVITLGGNTITPLTSFTESDPTVPSWAKASSKPSYTASEVGAVATTAVGAASGVCPLNSSSKIDATYLPSYVDDVIEAYARTGQTALTSTWLATESASGTVITPETGKIYVLMADSGDYAANTQFRWGGSAYVKLADGGVSAITTTEIDAIVAN